MIDALLALDWSDPTLQLAALAAVALPVLMLFLMLFLALRHASRAARATAPLTSDLSRLDQTVAQLGLGQQRLRAGRRKRPAPCCPLQDGA